MEVFYDQVGETERMHFDQGRWVSRQAFMDANPQWRAVVEPVPQVGEGGEDGDAHDRYACSKDPAKPLAVAKLCQQEEKRKREAREAAEAFVEMARAIWAKAANHPCRVLSSANVITVADISSTDKLSHRAQSVNRKGQGMQNLHSLPLSICRRPLPLFGSA